MPANAVVKTFDILKNDRTCLLSTVKGVALHTLAFEGTEKSLHGGIIVTLAHPRHTHEDVQLPQALLIATTAIGAALIGVQKHLFGRTTPGERHLQRLANQLLIVVFTHGPADY